MTLVPVPPAGAASPEVRALAAAINTNLTGVVVWKPDADPGDGYYTDLRDAAAATLSMPGPAVVKIDAPSAYDSVQFPGGRIRFRPGTILRGMTADADTDSDYRGWQQLLYCFGSGDPDQPTWLDGVVGFEDMYPRTSDYDGPYVESSDLLILSVDGSTVTAQVQPGTHAFTVDDIGRPIRIGNVGTYGGAPADTSNNNLYTAVSGVLDANTFTYENDAGADANDDNNGSIGWTLCTSLLIVTDADSPASALSMTNADLHYGGNQDWGLIHIAPSMSATMRLHDAASVRWFSLNVDGWLAVQSDGSACWVGSMAFRGDGRVEVYALPGTEVHTWQDAIDSWTLHQGTSVYTPDNSGNWDGTPETIHEALDRLAQRVYALENP